MKVMDYTELWDTELAGFASIALIEAAESTLLDLPEDPCSLTLSQAEKNLCKYLVIVLWSTPLLHCRLVVKNTLTASLQRDMPPTNVCPVTQLARAEEYTDCLSVERYDSPIECPVAQLPWAEEYIDCFSVQG